MENQKNLFSNLTDSSSLTEIQKYIEKVLKIRGFSNESVQDKLLHLCEEIGELVKSVRKYSPGSFVDPSHAVGYANVEEELADILILTIAVANKLNMNLFECLKNKEKINITRKWIKNSENNNNEAEK